MTRSFYLGLIASIIAAAGLLACGDDKKSDVGDKPSSKKSSLVATEMAGVTKQVGEQLGTGAGKADITMGAGSVSGALQGTGGSVTVSGSASQSGTNWSITTTFKFSGYEGATGIKMDGTIAVSYALDLDVSNPMDPKIKFTASVKGEVTVDGVERANVDMTVKYDNAGGLSCSGDVAGYSVANDCMIAGGPSPDAGLPQTDGATPHVDGSGPQADGSTTPAPTCNASLDTAACGGALSGKYVYKEACASADLIEPLKDSCAGVTASNIKATSKGGSLVFTGSTYVLASTAQVSYDAKLPASCAPMGCVALQATASAALSMLGATAATVTCSTGAGAGCDCKVSYALTLASSGSFTTSGGVATLDGGEEYYYCVSANGLQYMGKADTGDVGISYSLSKSL
jgi:hypothetical protein